MSLSFDEAIAELTAPGSRYELTEADVLGHPMTVFVNTPPSLRAIFDTARARTGVFLAYEDERWSFGDVMTHVDALAHALVHELGVAKGDRVGIAMRNYPEWVMSYAAITSIGAIAVTYNAWWTEDELDYGIRDSGTVVLIADAERVQRVAPLIERTGVRVVAVRTPGDLELPAGVVAWEDVVELGTAMPEVDIDLDDDATILYTSGTTGHPKGAVSTHRAVVSALLAFGFSSNVAAMRNPPKAAPNPYPTAFILVVPLFHVTGCVPVMLSCFLTGTKLVMMYKWNPERALELIERERVTNFVGVPTMSWDLLESPDFAARDTSSLNSVGGGGAPAPPELVKRIDKSFSRGRPNIGYGLTETNAYGPANSGQDYLSRPTSTGRTVPVMQVRVVGEHGEELPTGEVGEIEFRGPNLIRGYWGKPEANAETFHDGWLRTGDLGRIDHEGFVYVEDRVKDMVLRGGENIYCAEVEAVLYELPEVYEAAVFGIPHDRLGEELVAAIVCREGAPIDAETVQAHVARKLAGFKVPSRVELHTEKLPRGATGKILKRELRDRMVAGD